MCAKRRAALAYVSISSRTPGLTTPHHCWIHWLYTSLPLILSSTVSLQDQSNNRRSSFGIPRTLKPSANPCKFLIQLCWSIVKQCVSFSTSGLSCSLCSSAQWPLRILMSPLCNLCVDRVQLHRRGADDGTGVVQVRHVPCRSHF